MRLALAPKAVEVVEVDEVVVVDEVAEADEVVDGALGERPSIPLAQQIIVENTRKAGRGKGRGKEQPA